MFDVNEYFDGKVKSIALQTSTLPATVGVMAAGDYEFATSQKEVMTVVSGAIAAKLPGEEHFTMYEAGQSFTIAADQKFQVKIALDTAYFCTYE